jgi:hypothetical protein
VLVTVAHFCPAKDFFENAHREQLLRMRVKIVDSELKFIDAKQQPHGISVEHNNIGVFSTALADVATLVGAVEKWYN